WPLFSNRWFVEGRANYDFTAKTFLNALGGIQYNGGCWAVHAVMENYITNLNQYTQAYFVQFELKGLTSLGSGDPTSDLRLNIPGYVPVTSIH
ncbi:MAG: LPS-assembly protein LptD, partial [Burkholderiales bacterium]